MNNFFVEFEIRNRGIDLSIIRLFLPVIALPFLLSFFLSFFFSWLNHSVTSSSASSETQGQLVGTTGFSWAKVYNKSGRAPGHLLLPIQFQKRLNSLLLIDQINIFLANQRRGTARRLSCLLTRGCFPHRSP